MKFSVIMPFYNHFDLCANRLRELYIHVQKRLEIILVNDCSTDDVKSLVAFWQHKIEKHDFRYIVNSKNIGFGRSMNRGASLATGDVIVLLSNDVWIGADFTTEIESLLQENIRKLIGAELLAHDTGWNMFNRTIVPYLNGWFLACHADIWKELGGFDTRYGLSDVEDIDISMTATIMGIKLVQLRQSQLRHAGGQSFNYSSERESRTKRNIELFKEKWKGVLT